jgi:hypothetical protein
MRLGGAGIISLIRRQPHLVGTASPVDDRLVEAPSLIIVGIHLQFDPMCESADN